MPATLRFSASLKSLLGVQDELTVEPGQSVRDTLSLHGIKPELVAMVSVNGEMQTKEYIIRDKDTVRLLAVIGGG
jgi:sulfur carrier protein ThiS